MDCSLLLDAVNKDDPQIKYGDNNPPDRLLSSRLQLSGLLKSVRVGEFVPHGRAEDGSTASVGIRPVKTTAEYFQQ